MGSCESAACCGNEGNVDLQTTDGQKPFSQANIMEIQPKDEKQLKKIEALIKDGVSASQLIKFICPNVRQTLELLSKTDKNVSEFEKLCF